MITKDGYSKDPSIIPEGIVITFSENMVPKKNTMEGFIRQFKIWLADENNTWMHWMKNEPQHGDKIAFVYIIVDQKLKYRCLYGGYSKNGPHPHIKLAGPVIDIPFERDLSGFRGFRYCTQLH